MLNYSDVTNVVVKEMPRGDDNLAWIAIIISVLTFVYTIWVRRGSYFISFGEPQKIFSVDPQLKISKDTFREKPIIHFPILVFNFSEKPLFVNTSPAKIDNPDYNARFPAVFGFHHKYGNIVFNTDAITSKIFKCKAPYSIAVCEPNSSLDLSSIYKIDKVGGIDDPIDFRDLLNSELTVSVNILSRNIFSKISAVFNRNKDFNITDFFRSFSNKRETNFYVTKTKVYRLGSVLNFAEESPKE